MTHPISRRAFLAATAPLCASPALLIPGTSRTETAAPGQADVAATFPAQDPSRVQAMVGASHGNLARVQELLAESPALAKATWDWGFGDWETALGAASHTGNRPIAELLMAHGARPDLFTFAMLGQRDVVRAYVAAQPGIQGLPGPHGLTLLHHARRGGPEAEPVVAFLEEVGGADPRPVTVPLAESLRNGCIGNYAFDTGPDDMLTVTLKGDALMIKRLPDGSNRGLHHLGDRVFHPAGSAAVRIGFRGDAERATAVHVTDGPYVVMARRVVDQGGKS